MEVLDPGALAQLRALQRPDRPSLVGRVIALFREDAPRQVDSMRLAATSGANEDLKRAAHTLKSTAANIGARSLRETCARIEHSMRAGRVEEARAAVSELPDLLEAVLKALAREPEAP